MNHASRCFLLTAVLLTWSPALFAYLDPGTGSLIMTALAGGAAGAMVLFKNLRLRVLAFLGFRGPESRPSDDESDPDK